MILLQLSTPTPFVPVPRDATPAFVAGAPVTVPTNSSRSRPARSTMA